MKKLIVTLLAVLILIAVLGGSKAQAVVGEGGFSKGNLPKNHRILSNKIA